MTEENEKKGMSKSTLFGAVGLVLGLILGYLFGSGTGGVEKPDTSTTTREGLTTEIQLVNHIQAELPEQDVYVEISPGSSQVKRVDVEEADIYSENMLYSTATMIEHDPFKLGKTPLGPFQKGVSLGITLDEWLAGTGTGTYSVNGGLATLDLRMQNLVADGVYTVWCSVIKFPPDPVVVDLPCGAIDGSDNVFTADANGDGEISITMNPLEESTETTVNVIAVAYHSDGETYGPYPGSFGSGTHVQLFYLMPVPEQ